MAFWFTWKPPVKNSRKGVKVIKYIPMWCTCHCKLATASKSIQGTSKQEKTYFVHFCTFCTCTFGKNLVAMYKNVVGPPLLMRTVVHQISKTVDQRFLSPENSCTPILFEIIERQFSSPENRGEHNPENCSIVVHQFSSKQQTNGFLLLRTVVHKFSLKY